MKNFLNDLKEYVSDHKRGPDWQAGAEWARKWVVQYLQNYRRAYDESIFPPVDMEQYCSECRTATAGRMGRFLLDNCIQDLSAVSEKDPKV